MTQADPTRHTEQSEVQPKPVPSPIDIHDPVVMAELDHKFIVNPGPVVTELASQKIKENPEDIEALKKFETHVKKAVDALSSDSSLMLQALHERQEQRLTPLLDESKFYGMVSHLKSIQTIKTKFGVAELDEVTLNIKKISILIQDMQPQRGPQVRENNENLEKLIVGVKRFSGAAQDAYSSLRTELNDPIMDEARKELVVSLAKLSDVTSYLSIIVIRMRNEMR
jgi:hypothetical protein